MKKLFVFSVLACSLAVTGAPVASAQTQPEEEAADQPSPESESEEDAEETGSDADAEDGDGEESSVDESPDDAEADDAEADDAEAEDAEADEAEVDEAEADETGDEADGEDGEEPPQDAVDRATNEAEKAARASDEETAEAEEEDADAADEPEDGGEFETVEEAEAEEGGFGESPIADLADEEFVPLEDIEEGALEQIIPAAVYPHVEWAGNFRVRSEAAVNYDLDTRGTSAILPPAETYQPFPDTPADPDKDSLWGTNLRLKLDPTLHIGEDLRVHVEMDILDNVVLGSLPAAGLGTNPIHPFFRQPTGGSAQISPREREWFEDALQINEAYGEIRTLFGSLRAGRMDTHWGLGIFANDGDCLDCDFGSHVDRAEFATRVWKINGALSIDFPNEGVTSQHPSQVGGQPYDVAQVDDADQYTITLSKEPKSREDLELQRKRLLDDDLAVLNGGAHFRYRTQDGSFTRTQTPGSAFDPTATQARLAYKGMNYYVTDLWLQFLYEPDLDTYVRIELEGVAGLGDVDNVTGQVVGAAEEADQDDVNCFDESVRANEERCSTVDGEGTGRDIDQFALALESEFRFGKTVSFGVNGGFGSGGSSPNWGLTGSPDLDFYRFHPDYHVDLILFRRVIGTVTNAWYANPYAVAKFLESSDRRMEFQLDGILSGAWDEAGTPSGRSPWLGLEFDGALRYIITDMFRASLEGGILFPFDGLGGTEGRERLTTFGSSTAEFLSDTDPSLAWTVQTKLGWMF